METFFTTMRVTAHLIDARDPSQKMEVARTMVQRSYKMTGSLRNLSNKDNVKASSMGDDWKIAFYDRVARVDPKNKKACPQLVSWTPVQSQKMTQEQSKCGYICPVAPKLTGSCHQRGSADGKNLCESQ